MSLINEALKRARVEAAKQETGGLHDYATFTVAGRRKSRVPLLMVIGVGVLLLGGSSVAVLHFASWPAWPVVPARAVASVVPPDNNQPIADVLISDTPNNSPTTLPEVTPQVTPVQQPPVKQEVAATKSPSPALPESQTPPVTPAVPETPAPSVASSAALAIVAGKTYLRTIDIPGAPGIPGGGRLQLDAIIWSSDKPGALMNGMIIAPGDEVEGVLVVDIAPQRIKLKVQGKTFYLRLP